MKRIFIDLDGVIADFERGREDHPLSKTSPYIGRPDRLPGIYENLIPIKGAINAVNKLIESDKYDLYFLSTAPWDNPQAWTHKRLWIAKHFQEKKIRKRLILCHQKHFLMGDYLIDDRKHNGASEFQGSWIHFGSPNYPDWKSVIDHLLP